MSATYHHTAQPKSKILTKFMCLWAMQVFSGRNQTAND